MERLINIKKFFHKKKILITGNTGFIGSWLTIVLLRYNSEITGVSKNKNNKYNMFKLFNLENKIKYFQFDLSNVNKTKKFLKKNTFNIIIHLAAEPLIIDGLKNPNQIIKNNFLSTLNLINNIKNKKTLLVNFTTDKVYSNKNTKKKFKEDDFLNGDDPYSYSKVCVDMLTKMWTKNFYNFKCINIRCGNVIGGGDWNKKRLIPDLVKSIYENKKLTLRNLNSTRPWIFILELCNLMLLLIKKKYKSKKVYDEFNICPNNHNQKNIKWILNFFEINIKRKINYRYKKEFNEKIFLQLNNTKIKKYLKLNYRINDIKRFKETFDWYYMFYNEKNNLYLKVKKYLKNFEKFFFKI